MLAKRRRIWRNSTTTAGGISLHRLQRAGQVRLEIVDVFETKVQAYDSVAVVRAALRRVEIVSDRQAGHARPTVSDLEQLQGIHKSENLRLAKLPLEDDGEKAGRAGEVALPEFVSRAGGKRGMKHQFDLGTLCEPAGEREGSFLQRLQADGKSLHAAQGEAAIVRRSGAAHQLMG